MSKISHDPAEYVRGIQQILVSDKKRIGFLFGAGSSLAKKSEKSLTVPAVNQMTTLIVDELGKEDTKYIAAFEGFRQELERQGFNVETILSHLEMKARLIGEGELNGLIKSEFETLISKIKGHVRKMVSVHKSDEGKGVVSREIVRELVQTDFAEWIGQAIRRFPIEIFTTNYDFLFELGLEFKEIPYYDGFCGSFRPFFNSESVEDRSFLPNQTKIWKIHGSLGWHYDLETEKILRMNPDEEDILIYPSSLKYKDSKKQPYESLMDRLSNFLKQDDSILITCGYSWSDEHINSRIISALRTSTTSHVIGLIYGDMTEESLSAKIGKDNHKVSFYSSRHAVIGRKFGEWILKTEPDKEDTIQVNLYFDEDGPTNESDPKNEEKQGEEEWTGKGQFKLSSFADLVKFLNSMINDNEIRNLGKNAPK